MVENNADIVREALDITAPRSTRVWFLEPLGLITKAIDIVSAVYNKTKESDTNKGRKYESIH
ncbi:MAG: hypothetical protein DRJ35_01510 [Thermoprotei archaeon]|nr:MAG: hypothetical protein DRJ35_01510 [Thermoprotei archaeon]